MLLWRRRRMHLGKDISRWGLCHCGSRSGSSSIRSRYWEAVAGSFSSHWHISLQIGWRRPIVVVDGSIGGISNGWNLLLWRLWLPASATMIGLIIVREHSAGRLRGARNWNGHGRDRHLRWRLHVGSRRQLLLGDPHLREVVLHGGRWHDTGVRRAVLRPHAYRRQIR